MKSMLTVGDVAEFLGVSKRVVNHHIKCGRLKALDLGTSEEHNYRINPKWLEEFSGTPTPVNPPSIVEESPRPQLKVTRYMKRVGNVGA
jgi:hypothetical protein